MNQNGEVTIKKSDLRNQMIFVGLGSAILGATAVILLFSKKLFGYKEI